MFYFKQHIYRERERERENGSWRTAEKGEKLETTREKERDEEGRRKERMCEERVSDTGRREVKGAQWEMNIKQME